ncbi:hypothetical protein DM02DRAFT_268080 [Periconia macrospinosa]|uniref:Zn(2)-C6 fungal-type domain-containing protein n=1 Tax=Periconia macrospinosa TaxID=97972 RepID=A0A2V1DYZ7_9PLEO|nr:hypothetical protein DM02DRAFT_268080 [Periconia macrospinosa]
MSNPLGIPALSSATAPRTHSCVHCQKRKVKCDRNAPCAGCIKLGVDCVEAIPAPPRRRKRKASTSDLQSRLKRCEELLRVNGVSTGSPDGRESDFEEEYTPKAGSVPARSPSGKGKLIVDQGEPRFVDNTLWTGLTDEFKEMEVLRPSESASRKSTLPPSAAIDASHFLLGSNGGPIQNLTMLHPPPVQMFRLWQTFLDNVNPLSKVVHAPTTQVQVLDATTNLENLPANTEALLFAIYTSAICSLTDDECETMLGEPKSSLFPKYLAATKQALGVVGFIECSDIVVLQALVLLLISMRQNQNPHSLWILTGVALRIGQRMGLHADGATLGLPVFEAEMRRRIWWQIILLDNRTAQRAGLRDSITPNSFDTNLPANINDADLDPNRREMPLEHKYQTEMIFCLITYEIAKFIKEAGYQKLFAAPLSAKDKIMDELEARLHTKFLQYCDRSISLHTLCIAVAKSITANMRLMAHHPRHWKGRDSHMPQDERDILFSLSLQMLENDNMVHSAPGLKRYLWHVQVNFQFDAFIILLSELRRRPNGEHSNRAWKQVEEAFNTHRELTSDDSALYIAIGNLTLRAWEIREAHLAQRNQSHVEVPGFIATLRAKRPSKQETRHVPEYAPDQSDSMQQNVMNYAPASGDCLSSSTGTDFVNLDIALNPAQISPMDWDYWASLLQEYDHQIFG